MTWLLRDSWRNEQPFEGTEQQAAAEAQRLATARGVAVTYRPKIDFKRVEATTARMKRP